MFDQGTLCHPIPPLVKLNLVRNKKKPPQHFSDNLGQGEINLLTNALPPSTREIDGIGAIHNYIVKHKIRELCLSNLAENLHAYMLGKGTINLTMVAIQLWIPVVD